MSNAFLANNLAVDYVIPTATTSVTTDVISSAYNEKVLLTLSNFPLAVSSGTLPTTTTTTTTVATNTVNPLLSRSLAVTFESIYKNIASLPFKSDISNNKYLTRVYTLPDATTITVIIDMLTAGTIVTSISGNTGYTEILLKTVTYVKNVSIDCVYSLGAPNV